MPRTRSAYAPEFRRQMVDLVRAGRSPEELGKEFEPGSPFDLPLGRGVRSDGRPR